MKIGKATPTTAATAWYRYNNTGAASALYASTKTCNEKACKIEKRLCLHCLVQGRIPPSAGKRTKLSYFKANMRNC